MDIPMHVVNIHQMLECSHSANPVNPLVRLNGTTKSYVEYETLEKNSLTKPYMGSYNIIAVLSHL